MRSNVAAMLAGSSLLALASPVFAQTSGGDGATEDDAIVVTGSMIRGVAPAGANVTGFTAEDVEASGAINMNELLATLPQSTNFGSLGQGPGGFQNQFIPIQRVALRSLPGTNLGGGMQTLMLIDGHRVISGGINVVGVDANMVSPALVERVEVITDGGSAVYGSDAIAGVINYITRSRYDGIEADGSITFGQGGYQAWDTNVAAGTSWDSGSAFVAYNYSTHDGVFGRDIDYVRDYGRSTVDLSPLPTGTQCATPVVRQGPSGSQTFYSTAGVPLTTAQTRCDLTDNRDLYSEEYRYGLNAGLSQELTDALSFDLRGFYSRRVTISTQGPYGATVTVNPTSPFYNQAGAIPDGVANDVLFNFAPAFDNGTQKFGTTLEAWQVNPSLTWDLGHDWQLRTLLGYGESETTVQNTELVAARLNAAANGTGGYAPINVYDIGSNSPGALAALLGTNFQQGTNTFENAKITADGPLFDLPGGTIRIAGGAEWMRNDYSRVTTATGVETYPRNPAVSYEQTVTSVFGQISIPIFGEGNSFFLMNSLLFQASARYDDYNDFGSTVNPMLGLTYEPTDWLTIRANWGESFQAASPTDQIGAQVPAAIAVGNPGSTTLWNGTTNTDYYVSITDPVVQPLAPQTTENWSVGFTIQPPFLSGLTLSASYYSVELFDRIASPANSPSHAVVNAQTPDLYYTTPEVTAAMLAQFRAITGNLLNDYGAPGELRPDSTPYPRTIQAFLDNRRRNIGNNRVEGIDFSANYFHDMDWGSWDARISGTYKLTDEAQNSATAPWTNNIETTDPTSSAVGTRGEVLRLTASLGVTVDNLRAQASFTRQDGRDNAFYIGPVPANAVYQRDVDPFVTMDLFFRYDLGESGMGAWSNDATVSLNIRNATDEEPDLTFGGSSGTAGTTSAGGYSPFFNLGRTVTFAVSKRF